MADPKHSRHFTEEFRRQMVELHDGGEPPHEIMAERDPGRSALRAPHRVHHEGERPCQRIPQGQAQSPCRQARRRRAPQHSRPRARRAHTANAHRLGSHLRAGRLQAEPRLPSRRPPQPGDRRVRRGRAQGRKSREAGLRHGCPPPSTPPPSRRGPRLRRCRASSRRSRAPGSSPR